MDAHPPRAALAGLRELMQVVAGMVRLAQDGRWAELPALDARCTQLVAQLRALPETAQDACERAQVLELSSCIRADQERLQQLVRPQFAGLMQRMDEVQRTNTAGVPRN
ncbi:MAG TPA: flagellar protein FliT [Ramlibacter sp.]